MVMMIRMHCRNQEHTPVRRCPTHHGCNLCSSEVRATFCKHSKQGKAAHTHYDQGADVSTRMHLLVRGVFSVARVASISGSKSFTQDTAVPRGAIVAKQHLFDSATCTDCKLKVNDTPVDKGVKIIYTLVGLLLVIGCGIML